MNIDNDLLDLNNNEYDKWILEGALNINTGQTKYQSKVFVANSQITQYKSVRQCLLELEVRHHGWNDVNNKLKRQLVLIKMSKRSMDESDDSLEKELIGIELETMNYDCEVWEKKLKNYSEEITYYLELIKEISNNDKSIIEKSFEYDEAEDIQYWVKRMAKQAAMDMVSYGRIGSGNMDSIAMMPEEHQVEVLATTLQYNEKIQKGMLEINQVVRESLEHDEVAKCIIPNINDKLLVNENIQPTIKSKVKSTTI
jgi:hypothetical protein